MPDLSQVIPQTVTPDSEDAQVQQNAQNQPSVQAQGQTQTQGQAGNSSTTVTTQQATSTSDEQTVNTQQQTDPIVTQNPDNEQKGKVDGEEAITENNQQTQPSKTVKQEQPNTSDINTDKTEENQPVDNQSEQKNDTKKVSNVINGNKESENSTAEEPLSPAEYAKLKKEKLEKAIKMSNVPEMVTDIIDYAISTKTSDIHIQPEDDRVDIRFRTDGVLETVSFYNKRFHPALVSRVKIISNLKIDEQRIPQDGRAQYVGETAEGEEFEADLRVSTLPTVHGEKIVMRIQDRSQSIPPIESLGVRGIGFQNVKEIVKAPNGVILVSGPTGSGKTTTLYSILSELNKPDVNIMTLEDPVEYQMRGLSQCQIRADIGYDFATGLRTALRQDPDIIMIGEVRDHETIEIAIRAALTGHLVLSTIHTNSAIETITRIRDMGVENFLITSAVKGIIAQRLVRKVCPYCKEEYTPEAHIFEDIKQNIQTLPPNEKIDPSLLQDIKLYRGKGCEKCGGKGFKGRLGLYEILLVGDGFREKLMQEIPVQELENFAISEGMTTLKQDGIIKCLEGLTTIEEVYRVAND